MARQYVENGSIYIFKPDILCYYGNRLGGDIAYYIMQSWQSFEIDDLDDFMLCEWLYQRYLSEPKVERPEKTVHVIEQATCNQALTENKGNVH